MSASHPLFLFHVIARAAFIRPKQSRFYGWSVKCSSQGEGGTLAGATLFSHNSLILARVLSDQFSGSPANCSQTHRNFWRLFSAKIIILETTLHLPGRHPRGGHMSKVLFPYLVIALLLTSCSSPLFAPPTPTATLTPIPSSTPTFTPLPTFTLTSLPTATETLLPTATMTQPTNSVQSRDQFEQMVKSGEIKCQGSKNGGAADVVHFIDAAKAAGAVPNVKYTLGSGIPSAADPSQCLFLMTFSNGNTTIVYKDSETGEYVTLVVVE
jgi:hypothetical protein